VPVPVPNVSIWLMPLYNTKKDTHKLYYRTDHTVTQARRSEQPGYILMEMRYSPDPKFFVLQSGLKFNIITCTVSLNIQVFWDVTP
jgi:hypothetical protein